jgi:hypothetical protein
MRLIILGRYQSVRFEDFTAVCVNNLVVWDVLGVVLEGLD